MVRYAVKMKDTSNLAIKKKNRVVCFIIDNYDEMYDTDPDIITKLEIALAKNSAIPAKIDFPSKLCCATIVDESVTPTDVLKIIEYFGFHAKPSEE